MAFSIRVEFGGSTIEHKDFGDHVERISIGRSQECEIHLDNLGVSRKHAEIVAEGRLHVLRDLRSNNGTFVNGKRVKTYNLNDGDQITIGKFSLVYSGDPDDDQFDVDAPEEHAGGQTMMIDKSMLERRAKQRATALKAYLMVENGGDEETIFLDQSITTIGKSGNADIYVGGFLWFTKPRHAIIFRDETGFHIVDTSQKGTTYVNGNGVDIHRLRDGDQIEVGNGSFTFKVGTPVF